jgi:hypothetical protein
MLNVIESLVGFGRGFIVDGPADRKEVGAEWSQVGYRDWVNFGKGFLFRRGPLGCLI